jgi:hypothetical protein
LISAFTAMGMGRAGWRQEAAIGVCGRPATESINACRPLR